jgi:hypothetical protein
MNMNETDFPICPKHDSFMIEYNFEPWEAVLPQGTLEAFRCPNLGCSNVYITGAAEGLYTLEPRGTLKPCSSSGQE